MPNLSPLAELARRENEAMRRRCGITAPMTCSMFNPNAQAQTQTQTQAAPSQKADWPRLRKRPCCSTCHSKADVPPAKSQQAIGYPLHGTPVPAAFKMVSGRSAWQKAGTMRTASKTAAPSPSGSRRPMSHAHDTNAPQLETAGRARAADAGPEQRPARPPGPARLC